MASEFSKKYTQANIAPDAAPYDEAVFLSLHKTLASHVASDTLATAILATILCAQARGDAVVQLFRSVTKHSSEGEAEVKSRFIAVREAITLTVPFVGLPNCMPACFGLVNEIKGRGFAGGDGGGIPGPRRTNFGELDYTSRGAETVSRIYRGVGNSEVREMIQQFFPEMSYYGRTTVWGYLVGSSPILELKDAEMLVAASIMGLGATRQARSHVKCALSVGNSLELVTATVEVAQAVGAWNGRALLGGVDVGELAGELEKNLAASTT
ncbi:hypothetical protein BJX68DRAFT_264967 [Aspergillus pseudodeflectus]|uniref:Carboxymuconolactone decarboxylase-like domain-containing protein n=1 Tax=Aspergillus pseudodeflectus TaxID=176178 RepID=A0ABR4KNW0_9EURO